MFALWIMKRSWQKMAVGLWPLANTLAQQVGHVCVGHHFSLDSMPLTILSISEVLYTIC